MKLRAEETTYQPTADDVLWLSRAVQAEGPPQSRVAQTLVNGFMWARHELHSSRTLAGWVRAYAQPVNPAWYPDGALHKKRLAAATTDAEREALSRKAHARVHVHSARTKFSPDVVAAVSRALTSAPELAEATDYAAPEVVHAAPWKLHTEIAPGRNTFWTRPGAIGWRGYSVLLPSGGSGGGFPMLVLLALGLAVWWVKR